MTTKKEPNDKVDLKPADPASKVELNNLLSEIEKTYGKGSVMQWGNKTEWKLQVISSGSISLDIALGIGGYPKGRIVEIYGPEGTGKTTLALQTIAECQKQKGTAVFIDVEHALDPNYASALGVNLKELIIAQPDTGEEALSILEILVESKLIDMVVIDSVAALVPKMELEANMNEQSISLQARLMSKALRKLKGIIHKTQTTVIFINQVRTKVGVMFGSNEVTSGGRALLFYASLRLNVRRIQTLQEQGQAYANKTQVKIVKNKLSIPYRQAIFEIVYGQGINQALDCLDTAVKYNVIKRMGNWYHFNNQKYGPGKSKLLEEMKKNPDLYHTITKLVFEAANKI